ncbi:alpha-1 2-mannosidase [Clostridia bacterium]|nr:alpha-1 2-mannosidase [Clostridia bacterium]
MQKKTPADLVNPYIGTISHLLKCTLPEVLVPYGYIRGLPIVSGCSDYFCNDTVEGFPIGLASIMPGVGSDYENTLDHARENCRCYASSLILEKYDVKVELTVSAHCHFYRFHNADSLRITAPEGGTITAQDTAVRIFVPTKDGDRKLPGQFIVLQSNKALQTSGGEGGSLVLRLSDGAEFSAGVSFISFDKAEESLKKEAGNGFDAASAKAFAIWNDYLGRIKVEGNTEDKQIVFYTAIYRVFRRMVDFGEYGSYFSGFDLNTHEGEHFYTIDPLWDTFRTPHPLRMIVAREDEEQMLQSYVDMYKQSGSMPGFVAQYSEIGPMIGFHAAALFADAYKKGLSADYETAYEGIRKNAVWQTMFPFTCKKPHTEPDRCYIEKGFFPALKKGEKETVDIAVPFERRQAVSVTLEHSFDDWCVAQLAKALGKDEDYEYFMGRSNNWRNVYREDIGMFAPKDCDGNWVEDFDPLCGGGQGARDYFTENNAYSWQWAVPHNVEGLFERMGGNAIAEKKLDSLFSTSCAPKGKYVYMGQFPDSTGLMGQYCAGNEPSFNTPYLYNYLGSPWKTQKRVRQIMDIWFTNSPTGICGDEDEGALSGWLVFSALGFYPVCTGDGRYAIGTPLFDSAEIGVGGGKTFKVLSKGAGDGLRYISSARLNGAPLEAPFLTHEQIISGGELELVMGDAPVKQWNGSK